MQANAYAIKDVKAGLYLPPFTAPNHALAIRLFSTRVRDPQSDFHMHSEDFSLWHVGNWDGESGKLQSVTPERIAHANELLNQLELIHETNNT